MEELVVKIFLCFMFSCLAIEHRFCLVASDNEGVLLIKDYHMLVFPDGRTKMGGLGNGLLGQSVGESWNGVTAFGCPFCVQVVIQGDPQSFMLRMY
ncbi:unnamed protein product [Prunus armeniaca]